MTNGDVPEVRARDRRYLGDDRSFFLQRLFACYPQFCLVAERNDRMEGFLFAHPGVNILTVGPWVVWGGCEPVTMLEALADTVPNTNFRIGVLEKHGRTVLMLRSIPEFIERQPCLRMVRGISESTGTNPCLISIGSGAKG